MEHTKHYDLLFLSVVIGFAAFTIQDAISAESPVLVQKLPEYWALPASLSMETATVMSVVAAVYFLVMKCTPGVDIANRRRPLALVILQIVKIFLFVVLIMFWHTRTVINGKEYSVVFQSIYTTLIFARSFEFIWGLTYVGTLPAEKCVPMYYFGATFGCTVFGCISLLQGSGEFDCVYKHGNSTFTNMEEFGQANDSERNWTSTTSRTSVEVVHKRLSIAVETYFAIAAGCVAFCATCLLIHIFFTDYCSSSTASEDDSATVNEAFVAENDGEVSSEIELNLQANTTGSVNAKHSKLNADVNENSPILEDSPKETQKHVDTAALSRKSVLLILYIFVVKGLCSGVARALMTYATLPYGPLTYSIGRRVSDLLAPLGNLAYTILPINSLRSLTITFGIFLVLSLYVCVTACMSPSPPLVVTHPDIGSSLAVSMT